MIRSHRGAPGLPSTKPRALNVALAALRGDYVVVYDAEDEPEPDQLRLAAACFAADPDLDCLHARLTIENAGDSWISTMFAIEYAALFDLINPGLAALGLPIALGGTSNHFRARTLRRVGGWDAWNVTEDADLGIRLAREGARVAALASDTREEAPNDLGALVPPARALAEGLDADPDRPYPPSHQIPARARSDALAGRDGAHRGLRSRRAVRAGAGDRCAVARVLQASWRESSAWRVAGDVAIYTLMASGLTAVLVPAFVAMHRRGMATLDRVLLLLPVYYVLISAASWVALFDLAIRPFYWAKTKHGQSRKGRAIAPPHGAAS